MPILSLKDFLVSFSLVILAIIWHLIGGPLWGTITAASLSLVFLVLNVGLNLQLRRRHKENISRKFCEIWEIPQIAIFVDMSDLLGQFMLFSRKQQGGLFL